jgi:hypothetical protein
MIIGITGHQDLGDEQIDWVKYHLVKELGQVDATKGMSCLARGTDQLFAQVIIENGIELIAVIPSKDYETTFFNSKDLQHFKVMVKQAFQVKQMDCNKATESAFYQASQYIVDCCDILFAVWNSQPSKGFGGTADVVSYADKQHKKIIHLNPLLKTIKYYNYGKS